MRPTVRRGAAVVIPIAVAVSAVVHGQAVRVTQPAVGVRSARVLTVQGLRFKDLNKNGSLDPYEDWRQPVAVREDNLLTQMTLEEKAGLMVGPRPPVRITIATCCSASRSSAAA